MSKYDPLKTYLQSSTGCSVDLTFREIELIIDDTLPRSSRVHQAWWSNSLSHVQGEAWINAYWVVDFADLETEQVKFSRSTSKR